jgi:hypothetical protein
LWIVAVGLACFAGWRLLQAFFDADQFGSSLYGLLRRAEFAASSVFYIGLSAVTVQVTFAARAINDNRAARDWTHWALSKPAGRALVAAIAMGFVSAAVALIIKVLCAHYLEWRRDVSLPNSPAIAISALIGFGMAL